jgi:large subunit ribosomal protein L22
MVKATLNDYRQSPRKVRLVANLIKGKDVDTAIATLTFTVKDASFPIKKLIESAIANAKNNFNLERAQLFVKEILVNAGPVLKRSSAGTRGSAMPIKKRTSHVDVILDVLAENKIENKDKKAK